MLLGVDVGGTFTDAVVAVGDRLVTAKAPTTPEDQSEGVLAAVRAALERAGASADEVRAFAHGTTVATNALLEGEGARTVLVATRGLRGRGRARPPGARRPLPALRRPPGAARAAASAASAPRERMGPDGPARGALAATRCAPPSTPSRRPSPRPSPSACCTPTATRSTSGRSARRWRSACRTCTSRSRTRRSARSASSSAPPRPRSTPPSPPCCAPTCAGSSSARARPGCPSPR